MLYEERKRVKALSMAKSSKLNWKEVKVVRSNTWKGLSILVALALALSLVVVAFPMAGTVAADTLCEHYNTGDMMSTVGIWQHEQQAQTFIAESNHSVSKVRLKLYRIGSPGTITVSIRATTGGKPVGGDLTSGTTNGNTLPADFVGAWREINLTPYSLNSGIKYAIVVRALSASSGNYVYWRLVYTGGYANGTNEHSWDYGSTWQTTTSDCMFEVYSPGDPPSASEVNGVTTQVNCDILPGVNLQLFDAGGVTPIGSPATSDGSGDYTLAASVSTTGTYLVVASKAGYQDKSQAVTISALGEEYEVDFSGNYGLIPDTAPGIGGLDYFLLCMNLYLEDWGDCNIGMDTFLAVMNAYLELW